MLKAVKITPRFKTKEILDSTIRKDWFILQNELFNIGEKVHKYMRNYINKNRKRQGGTGNLASSINLIREAGAGLGKIFIGIGDISILNTRAKFWYVVNYGKTVGGRKYIPYYGAKIAGYYQGGDGRPKSEYAGKGIEAFRRSSNKFIMMQPKHPIRPMRYIQASNAKLMRDIRLTLNKLKRG